MERRTGGAGGEVVEALKEQGRARTSRIPTRSLVFRIVIPLVLAGMFLLLAVLVGVAAAVLLGLLPWQ